MLMRVEEARIANEQLHNMFKAMVDQHEMQCEPKGLAEYLACNVCRIVFTGNKSDTVPVQSTYRKFIVFSASNRYTNHDQLSQAVWHRIYTTERWHENRSILKALADHLMQHAKSVEELLRTAPETSIMAEQRAKNASTDEMFIAWLAQKQISSGVNGEELSSSELLAHATEFKEDNPTDTREKWCKNLTAQKMSNSVLHLQTACSIPGIGAKQKKSKVVRYFHWRTILQHCKHRGLVPDEDGCGDDDDEETDVFEQPLFIDSSSSSSSTETDAPAAKAQRVV